MDSNAFFSVVGEEYGSSKYPDPVHCTRKRATKRTDGVHEPLH